jgi:hypothetical protein
LFDVSFTLYGNAYEPKSPTQFSHHRTDLRSPNSAQSGKRFSNLSTIFSCVNKATQQFMETCVTDWQVIVQFKYLINNIIIMNRGAGRDFYLLVKYITSRSRKRLLELGKCYLNKFSWHRILENCFLLAGRWSSFARTRFSRRQIFKALQNALPRMACEKCSRPDDASARAGD